MQRIINYSEIPESEGETIYIKMDEVDPKLYLTLMAKRYRLVSDIRKADESTIYLNGQRQISGVSGRKAYIEKVNDEMQYLFHNKDINKPRTVRFSFIDLLNFEYKIPFVLKNESLNGGKEKYLIETKKDYYQLIRAFYKYLQIKNLSEIPDNTVEGYIGMDYVVQEYIETPSEYCTSMRVVTSSSNDLMYATLKYKEPEVHTCKSTLLGYLLTEVFPLSTKTIVSNTLSGGENVIIGEPKYEDHEKRLLESHNIGSEQFQKLITTSCDVHSACKNELGIICGFDFIYDAKKDKWYYLEFHSKPMLKSYGTKQNIPWETEMDRYITDGRVRATALSLTLNKARRN